MRRFFCYWYGCLKTAVSDNTAFANDWQWLFGVPILAALLWIANRWFGEGTLSIGTDTVGTFIAAFVAFVITWLCALSARLLNAPVKLDREKTARISQLEKVDAGDLEYLLHGFYFDDTFVYKSEITLCKEYKGRLEISQLRDNLTDIRVRAPKHSLARIMIRLSDNRQASKCYVYYIDKRQKLTQIENIYEEQLIYVDLDGCFRLKLVYDDDYLIDDQATLRITVNSWTK